MQPYSKILPFHNHLHIGPNVFVHTKCKILPSRALPQTPLFFNMSFCLCLFTSVKRNWIFSSFLLRFHRVLTKHTTRQHKSPAWTLFVHCSIWHLALGLFNLPGSKSLSFGLMGDAAWHTSRVTVTIEVDYFCVKALNFV